MKKKILGILISTVMLTASLFSGCSSTKAVSDKSAGTAPEALTTMQEVNEKNKVISTDDKYRTTYEIFVGSFYDSNGDGTGDLKGVEEKLDYIKDMGFDQIWLMPINPSPTYHKYDVSNYMGIDASYGTLDDFESLLAACHKDGIRLIMDLVLNHTSSAHPWFKEARDYIEGLKDGQEPDASECPYVDYYNFVKDGAGSGYEELGDTDWYYEARFWSGMPDLNLDNDAVRDEIKKITDFWLDEGVDGFRLDAVTSYYTGNEQKNIDFLSWLNDEVKAKDPDAYMVGECWSDLTTYARYYKSGIDSFFDFAFADATGTIANTVKGSVSALNFGKAMVLAQDAIAENSENGDGIEAPFYTNHDMARSAGYYPGDDGSKVKFAEGLNLMMSGTAFVYYGEEIGMKGSGKDENKRAPMYWTSDSTADGMTEGPKDMDSFEMKFDPEDAQQKDEGSILNYVKQAVLLRNCFPAIARGKTAVIDAVSNDSVLGITKTCKDSSSDPVVILYNTSEEAQTVNISDLPDGYRNLSGELVVGKDLVTIDEKGGKITMPKESIAVLTMI